MEKALERVMEETMASPQVLGCVFADHQGLCLAASDTVFADTAGILCAIADEASKLEPHIQLPVITLESDNRVCIIQQSGAITGAIFKST